MRNCWLWLSLFITTTFLTAGCQSTRTFLDSWRHHDAPPPVAIIPTNATVGDIIDVVNRQNQQIQSLTSSNGSISMPQTPPLSAEIQFFRPNYLHLTAKTHVTGKELDMGQNPELFWFWLYRNPCPGVYYCRHNEFYNSNARDYVPIDPNWVVDALGLNLLDPNAPWEGPTQVGNGTYVELRLRERQAGQNATRQILVNRFTGTIAAQRIYDANNVLLVDATVRKNRRDSLTGFSIPQKIDITVPREEFKMTLDLGAPDLNRLSSTSLNSWNIPQNLGAPLVNLAQQPPRNNSMAAGQSRQY